ncbi:MAG: hypothetical protein WCK98_07455 [bacterium]
MKFYLEYTDFSLLQAFICQQLNLDLAQVLESGMPGVSRYKIEKWQDIEEILGKSNFFFEEGGDQNLLLDIGQLEINDKSTTFLKEQDFASKMVFIYSSEDKNLSLDQKKLLKKFEFDYQNLKSVDADLALEISQSHTQKIGLKITENDLKKLIKQSKSYQEIIDNLDLIDLSGDTVKALKSILIEEELPLFMYGFSTTNLEKDSRRWYAKINEENVQLALSLIYGKLEKNATSVSLDLQKKLILTDKNIKNSTKLSPVAWVKLFLWQAKNI